MICSHDDSSVMSATNDLAPARVFDSEEGESDMQP